MSLDLRKTVMIVEDNDLNMRLFNDILQAKGYNTLQDKDGSNALDMAEEHRPDLILMDIRLPNVSGIDLTRAIKARDHLRHIPVIAVTASSGKDDGQQYIDQGCDGFIAKPISVRNFLEAIDKFLA